MENNVVFDLATQYAIYVLESLRDAQLTEDYYKDLNIPIPPQLEGTITMSMQRAEDAKKSIEEVAPGLWDRLAKNFLPDKYKCNESAKFISK